MKLPNTANVLDLEHDNGRLIEIGFTTVSLKDRKIVQSYSLPIKPDFELTPEVTELTGWTTAKLLKSGISIEEACRRMEKHGFASRLLVTDQSDEVPFLEAALGRSLSSHRLNVSIMLTLATGNQINLGLIEMLRLYGLEFEGRQHSGRDDSFNIARLFVKLLPPL